MGKHLQVRVMAYTVDPDRLAEDWPKLCALAYPPEHDYAPAKRGVIELIETLRARVSAKDVPADTVAKLKSGLDAAVSAAATLEKALAEWKADEAQKLTERIESILGEMEDAVS